MTVKTMLLGDLGTNVYIVYEEDTGKAIIIDPAADPQRVMDFIEEKGLTVMGLLVTHGHYDHIQGIDRLRQVYGVPVFTSKGEEELMGDPHKNLSIRFQGVPVVVANDECVEEGEILQFSTMEFRCIVVPGHSPESVCYYSEEEGLLFCGDTLFPGAIGRTDFYSGPSGTLVDAIVKKLLVLPEETRVYSGHGIRTTIGYEKRANPYLPR